MRFAPDIVVEVLSSFDDPAYLRGPRTNRRRSRTATLRLGRKLIHSDHVLYSKDQ